MSAGDESRLPDLTRWNRVGLGRFAYVDANAATLLDELRIQMLVRYLRGLPTRNEDGTRTAERDPAFWREVYRQKGEAFDVWRRPGRREELLQRLPWQETLYPQPPREPETPAARNQRLLGEYGRRSDDHAAEIMRAFARAAHVLLGHVDAFANEGYLRTATQWESLRRLAAMVGYHPTPAASATTLVALIVMAGSGTREVARGIAMRHAPPAGGRPVVLETIRAVTTHPDLNRMRVRGATRNLDELPLAKPGKYLLPKDVTPSPGDLVLVAGEDAAIAARIATVAADRAAGIATILLEGETLPGDWPRWSVRLLMGPLAILRGAPRPSSGRLVVESPFAGRFNVGEVVQLTDASGRKLMATVAEAKGGHVAFASDQPLTGAVQIQALTPYRADARGLVETGTDIDTLYVARANQVARIEVGDAKIGAGAGGAGQRTADAEGKGAVIAHRFRLSTLGTEIGYAASGSSTSFPGEVATAPPPVTAALRDADATVTFPGKPPKDLAVGDRFVARQGEQLTPLLVLGLRSDSDRFHVRFDRAPGKGDLAGIEFHGPMRQELRPVDHDRGQGAAVDAGAVAVVDGLAPEAAALLVPGRQLLLVDERPGGRPAAIATVRLAAPAEGGGLGLGFQEGGAALAGFVAGWTLLHANTAPASHGESLGSKVLGSGNGELARQTFNLPVQEISFVPSTASETGYVPDIEVQVSGRVWLPRDASDPTADGSEAWSPIARDDGTLDLRFRARLVSGSDNVVVTRHRVGAGPRGNGVPPFAVGKPADRHAVVEAIVQPLATAGGAEREQPADIRTNAPGRLSANDRAVAATDFAILAQRHPSVWQAHAEALMQPGRRLVRLTLVPAGGGALTPALQAILADHLRARMAPGIGLDLRPYRPLDVRISATLRIDTARFVADKVRDAAVLTLLDTFSLRRRRLGQPMFIGEILAALETVEGVTTAVAGFDLRDPAADTLRLAHAARGGLVALFPHDDQVALLASASDALLVTEAAT